ncbi:MAG: histidinol dehydrogenase, partial [Actinomycetota bacterium]
DGASVGHPQCQLVGPPTLELEVLGGDGVIFCGPHSPASVGDYVAGPSHVLPTYGSARFASALTVADFCKDHHIVTIEPEGLDELGPHVIALADQEGLDAHAESIRIRLRDRVPASDQPVSEGIDRG